MRTNIELNNKLIGEAMKLSHSKTKREVVELALENFVNYLKRQKIKTFFGKVRWEGNLAEMRKT
ncbi:MAG: type II toxin-antitoxin system VapB family antitoxin [Bacteroidia bacterium]|nr:type II toxin-antitoxin system VapB family antitoxin [Bacteroidia bacterium]